MFTDVLTFAQRAPRSDGPTFRGRVVGVDLTIGQVEVVLDESGERLALSLDECTEALREVVMRGDPTVMRVDCDVERGWHVLTLHLTVDEARVASRLARGSLPAEEHVVHLVRSVWRDARVPVRGGGDTTQREMKEGEAAASSLLSCALWREDAYPLFAHQRKTVDWMTETERRPSLSYAQHLAVGGGWYVDVEAECLTQDPGTREVHLAGGICADATGTGKTATALRLVAETCRDELATTTTTTAATTTTTTTTTISSYRARASLVVVPLNLLSQWMHEIRKFLREGGDAEKEDQGVRLLCLTQAKDLKGVTLQDVCTRYDLVLTTFNFLRACRGYVDLVESALGGRPRSRASLSAWARQRNHTEPVLEAVRWRRVVVDEIHEVFESAKDARALRLFDADALWGLTATPSLDQSTTTDHHPVYLLLRERVPQHHPNLLAELVRTAVRAHTSSFVQLAQPTPALHRVRLSAEECLRVAETPTAQEVVRRLSFVDEAVGEEADAVGVEELYRCARERAVGTARAEAEGHARTVEVLQGAHAELEAEYASLLRRCLEERGENVGPLLARAQVTRQASESHARDLTKVVQLREAALLRVARLEAEEGRVRERLSHGEACVGCGARCEVVLAPCAHLSCRACSADECPVCGAEVRESRAVAQLEGVGSKMKRIGELVLSFASEPVLLFLQYKTMFRGTRSVLRSAGVRVLTLDGNSKQRSATLADFATGGGVLLLCTEDSFAGLHLPHVRHVVFAHAFVGDKSHVRTLETQAIARCVRHGQRSEEEVRVYSFVVEDSAEEDQWVATRE